MWYMPEFSCIMLAVQRSKTKTTLRKLYTNILYCTHTNKHVLHKEIMSDDVCQISLVLLPVGGKMLMVLFSGLDFKHTWNLGLFWLRHTQVIKTSCFMATDEPNGNMGILEFTILTIKHCSFKASLTMPSVLLSLWDRRDTSGGACINTWCVAVYNEN